MLQTTHTTQCPLGFTEEELAIIGAECTTAIDLDKIRERPHLVLNASTDLGLQHDGKCFADQLAMLDVPHVYKIVEGTGGK